MDKIVIVCNNEIENILTGIYKAFELYKSGHSLDNINIIISEDGHYDISFLTEYIHIKTDFDKAYKTMEHIKTRLGGLIHRDVLYSLCHFDANRGYVLFRFLHYCFKNGRSAAEDLTNPYVLKVMELSRKCGNETHHYYGFVRFNSMNNILYAKIKPKCNVIPLIIEHFSDRFYIENWIIEDETHNLYAVHKANGDTRLFRGDLFTEDFSSKDIIVSDKYEQLWKTFFETIAIKERTNPKCQRNLMPLWIREHMNEFQS